MLPGLVKLQKRFDNSRVELAARTLSQHLFRMLGRPRALIRPIGGQRIEGVRNGDDAGAERYLLADKSVRVTFSVEMLVVVGD
jgi:hypothetical protein